MVLQTKKSTQEWKKETINFVKLECFEGFLKYFFKPGPPGLSDAFVRNPEILAFSPCSSPLPVQLLS